MKRGFGSPNYNPDRAREVRQAGNRAQRAAGKAPCFTTDTAPLAGSKGGERLAELRYLQRRRAEAA
jgi:hypothetical protein